ncbi:MAG TPA: hypothetical protein VI636_11645 [Candidatus Angelobacter sp.]
MIFDNLRRFAGVSEAKPEPVILKCFRKAEEAEGPAGEILLAPACRGSGREGSARSGSESGGGIKIIPPPIRPPLLLFRFNEVEEVEEEDESSRDWL